MDVILKTGLDLLAITAGPQPNSTTYLGLVPATAALGELLVGITENPGPDVFSDYLVTEHGWDEGLAGDAGALLSCALSGEQDQRLGEIVNGDEDDEDAAAEAVVKPRGRFKRRKVGQLQFAAPDEETPPDEKVVPLSEYRLPRHWRRALDLVVSRLPPADVRRTLKTCPSGRDPAKMGQVPATELFSKVIRRYGWIMERQWIADYLADRHGVEEEYIRPIMEAYHFAHSAGVDCFWDWKVVDALGYLDAPEFRELHLRDLQRGAESE